MFLFKSVHKSTISNNERYGFTFPEEPSGFLPNLLLLCLIRALLIFCTGFGTIGGILSAFHIHYHHTMVMMSLLAFSFLLAFLHYHPVLFNVSYPLLFIFYTFSIFQFRQVVNSGFQSFITILYEAYSEHFHISLTRNVTISYDNRFLSISVAAIVVCFFFLLLLNIAISTYMSLVLTLCLTLPILQIALYIEKYPS